MTKEDQEELKSIGTTLLNIALQKVYDQSIDQIAKKYYGHTFHMKETKLATDPVDKKLFCWYQSNILFKEAHPIETD